MNRLQRGAALQRLHCKGHRCTMHLALKGIEPDQVVGGVLQFRSKTEEIAVPFDTRVKRRRSGSAVRLDLQLDAHLPLKELYWDAYVQIRQFGAVYPVKIVSAKPLQRWQLFFTNCQALVDDTHILFPYYRKGGQLCYCYRPLCE